MTTVKNDLPFKLERPEAQADGSIIVSAVFASTGVYEYDTPDFKGLAYLPAAELQKDRYLKTVNGCPFIAGHETVAPDNYNKIACGNAFDVKFERGKSVGKIRVYRQDVIDSILNANEPLDVSLQYKVRFEPVKGIRKGRKFDAIQRDLEVNHIALVGEANMPEAQIQNEKKESKMDLSLEDIKNTVSSEIKNQMEKAEEKGKEKGMHEKMENMLKNMQEMRDSVKNMLDEAKKCAGEKSEKENTSDAKNSYQEVSNARALGEKILGDELPRNLTDMYSVASYVCNQKLKKKLSQEEALSAFKVMEHFEGATEEQGAKELNYGGIA